MINRELLSKIDSCAFQNRPLPSFFSRSDKTVYRMYYSFVRMLYMLYRAGTLDKDRLMQEKTKYMKDTEILFVITESAFKTIRERQGIQEYGSITTENVPDINMKRALPAEGVEDIDTAGSARKTG